MEDMKTRELITDAAIGNGPVDAVFKTISRLLSVSLEVALYEVKSITRGSDSLGEVKIFSIIAYSVKNVCDFAVCKEINGIGYLSKYGSSKAFLDVNTALCIQLPNGERLIWSLYSITRVTNSHKDGGRHTTNYFDSKLFT